MVKIKDFTLASQNLGGTWPSVPYTPGAHAKETSLIRKPKRHQRDIKETKDFIE